MIDGEVLAARDWVAELLASIPGLTVVDHPSEAPPQTPAALVTYEGRDTVDTLGASLSVGRFRVTLLVASADSGQAYDRLYELMADSASTGIEALLAEDTTWGGSVDYGHLESVGNVGERRIGGGRYVAADLRFRYVRRTRAD